jgi:cytochrome c oxidase subunit I+III
VSLVGLVGWFWPQASERLAIAELGPARPGELGLGVVGPTSNGWWGTLVLLVILATALASLVASYAYLATDAAWPGPPGGAVAAILGVAAVAAGCGALRLATRSLSAARVGRRRAALVAALSLHIAFVALDRAAYGASGVAPETSAHGSMVLALFLFAWLVGGLVLAMLGTAALWAWRAPTDVRGHAILVNTALVAYFGLVTALTVLVTTYLGPVLA